MKETCRTSDIHYAAYLRVAEVPMERIESEGKRRFFVFKIPEGGIEDLKTQYFSRRAKVSALTYADEIRALKTILHDGE